MSSLHLPVKLEGAGTPAGPFHTSQCWALVPTISPAASAGLGASKDAIVFPTGVSICRVLRYKLMGTYRDLRRASDVTDQPRQSCSG